MIGSSYNNTLQFKFGKILSKLICFFKKGNKSAKIVESLSFKAYGKKFENGNWLTRNEKIFQKYINDKYCGTSFPYSFYNSMFTECLKNYKNLKTVENKVPVLIISGDKDPVGENGKSVIKLSKVYGKANFPTTLKLYQNCRHEILNELNRKEVYQDIIIFIKNKTNN